MSVALHALQHLNRAKQPMTSEALGALLRTNPVVIRRMFAGLREAGMVRAEKGHGGGWSLARPLDRVTLRDVYEALGILSSFALIRPTSHSRCVLERAADRALLAASSDAQEHLLARLGSITVPRLLGSVRRSKEP
jgi:DNA-binding IscR family transcriptional regulator